MRDIVSGIELGRHISELHSPLAYQPDAWMRHSWHSFQAVTRPPIGTCEYMHHILRDVTLRLSWVVLDVSVVPLPQAITDGETRV